MKILTVVGARPQFIKAAALSRILRREHTEILVHTGQHYDYNMSDVFFDELSIPHPDYNLGVSGGTHAQMTGRMMIAIEEVLIQEKPDAFLVYGDTNSTLAGALAAVKLHIPVIHVEAGSRVCTIDSPEEVNRICTDHVSTLKFGCTQSAMDFMAKEGLLHNGYLVGDPMYDAFCYYSKGLSGIYGTLTDYDGITVTVPERYYYMTCHRQENTGSDKPLFEILSAMNSLEYPTIYPVHPRNRAMALDLKEKHGFDNIIMIQPVGYLTSISLIRHCEKVVTDSGGLQREAFFAEKQCVCILEFVAWPETMVGNRNQISHPDKDEIIAKLSAEMTIDKAYQPFGDGHACEKICEIIDKVL